MVPSDAEAGPGEEQQQEEEQHVPELPPPLPCTSLVIHPHGAIYCAHKDESELPDGVDIGPSRSLEEGSDDLRLVVVTCPPDDEEEEAGPIGETKSTALSLPLHSSVPFLFKDRDILVGNIFTFLDASDLGRVATCCKYLSEASEAPQLWAALIRSDFNHVMPLSHLSAGSDGSLYRQPSDGTTAREPQAGPSLKHQYRHALRSALDHVVPAKLDLQRRKREAEVEARLNIARAFLDIALLRVGSVLPLFALLATLVLFSIEDSRGMSKVLVSWMCVSPLYFCWFYYAISFLVVRALHRHHEASPSSPAGCVYPALRGPVPVLYNMGLGMSRTATYSLVIFGVLILLQLVAIGLKLSEDIPAGSDFKWAVVLLPTWLSFLGFLIFPCVAAAMHDGSAYIDGTVLFLIPPFILLVCLAAKLDGEDGRRGVDLDLDVVLVPLWIIEGAVLLTTTGYLVTDFIKLRRGYLESMNESLGFSAIVFGFLVPLVLTQALLSVRDQEQASHSITVAGALAPLMALIFALLVVCAAYAWSYETPFQVERRANYLQKAGINVDFPLPP